MDRARSALANEAARIICETGLRDYRLAKLKAAEHLPGDTRGGLPSNSEIRDAVLEYQQVFGGETFDGMLRGLREQSMRVMRWLADFRPRLVGGVLSGAIGLEPSQHDIQLHVFADAVEELDIHLMNHGVDFHSDAVRLQARRGVFTEFPVCEFMYERTPVAATVFSERASRHAPISSIDDQPIKRASIKDIQRLFADAARRALDAGFEWLELHFAHGYLGSSFFSPLANQRSDAYGGSVDNRVRFHLETLDAVRAVWPERYPLTMRLGSDDLHPQGVQFDDAVFAVVDRIGPGNNLQEFTYDMRVTVVP